MIFKTYSFNKIQYHSLCEQSFSTLSKPLNKWRKDFILDVLWLILSIQGKINFLQLARYGKYGEQHYRSQFSKKFDFLGFNSSIVHQHCSENTVIAFDPSYIPKSGKKTAGAGYFWSGCSSRALWGLEIGGIAAVDIDNHTALHLEAIQTLVKDNQTLLDYYAHVLIERKDELQKISNTVVADAYFSKAPFIKALTQAGFEVVSRFRDDVRLTYIIEPVKTGKQGRPKTIGEAVDINQPDMKYFKLEEQENQDVQIFSAEVKAVALKRKVKVCVVRFLENGKVKDTKIFFSTDLKADGIQIWKTYRSRFQIEFLYRDAKQHTGLTNCQARDENKLHFHFNASLTAVNIAKIVHWFSIPKQEREPFSMRDIKIVNHNTLLLEKFFAMYGINPNILKNKQKVKELLCYGTKAA